MDWATLRASYVRNQKTDKRDAAHILKLLMEQRFPRRWRPASRTRTAALADPSSSAGRHPRRLVAVLSTAFIRRPLDKPDSR
jgi:hypothetical protein